MQALIIVIPVAILGFTAGGWFIRTLEGRGAALWPRSAAALRASRFQRGDMLAVD